MGALIERQRAFLIHELEEAARAGHEVRLEVRDRTEEFPDEPRAIKHWACCSCGWESRPWAAQGAATLAGVWHAAGVVGLTEEERLEARRVGLKVPAFVGPRL